MEKSIPAWAFKEVDKRVPKTGGHSVWDKARHAERLRYLAASLIAKYEKETVAPLLIEAREIVAKHYENSGSPGAAKVFRTGEWDDRDDIQCTIKALLRGIELGKENK